MRVTCSEEKSAHQQLVLSKLNPTETREGRACLKQSDGEGNREVAQMNTARIDMAFNSPVWQTSGTKQTQTCGICLTPSIVRPFEHAGDGGGTGTSYAEPREAQTAYSTDTFEMPLSPYRLEPDRQNYYWLYPCAYPSLTIARFRVQ